MPGYLRAGLTAFLAATLLLVGCIDEQYSIVLEPDPSPSELHAADELQTYFKACTGREIPILEDPSRPWPRVR